MTYRNSHGYIAGIFLVFGVVIILFAMAVYAWPRDLGQWGDVDPAQVKWFAGLMQPDNPQTSCCGEADAYWADEQITETDEMGKQKVIAIITDERDDEPLKRLHEPVGKRYEVPPNKIVRKDGNPTGHFIIFFVT